MKYSPKLGKEFPIIKMEALGKTAKELTRSMIALTIVVPCVLALIGAAWFGFYRGEFSTLAELWKVLAAPLGMVLGHYFPGSSANGKDNHESTA